MKRTVATKMNVETAVAYMEKVYGDDIEILGAEQQGENVRVVWRETNDPDTFFSLVGLGRGKQVIEKVSGEA